MKISLIAALGKNRELGLDNKMLWHIPEDFKSFKKITMGHTMIMGRKTFESIGKPLPGRKTIVLTRNKDLKIEGVEVVHSKGEAIGKAHLHQEDELFIVGGAEIYNLFLKDATDFYLSKVDFTGEADTFFPEYENFEWKVGETIQHEPTEKTPAWDFVHLLK